MLCCDWCQLNHELLLLSRTLSCQLFIVYIQRNKEARQHNGRIVECYWDIKSGWNFMRVREDKSFPNGYTTAMSECLEMLKH